MIDEMMTLLETVQVGRRHTCEQADDPGEATFQFHSRVCEVVHIAGDADETSEALSCRTS